MAFVYLRNDVTGQHLGAGDGQLSLAEHCGDAEMWTMVHRDTSAIGSRDSVAWEYTLMSPVSDVVLTGTAAAPIRPSYGEAGTTLQLALDGAPVDADGGSSGDEAGIYTALTGPTRLPSTYVQEMRDTGYAILDGILQPDDIAELRRTMEDMKAGRNPDTDVSSRQDTRSIGQGGGKAEPDEGRWSLDNNELLSTCPAFAKGSFHPVAMWCIQQYLGVPEIMQSHIPIFTILKPAKKLLGERPAGGWHSVCKRTLAGSSGFLVLCA